MSAIKAKNTKPEVILRKALWQEGIKGYRIHIKNLPGRPDLAFTKKKVAVFVNGCFWHRCPICKPTLPKTNTDFWKDKFDRNVKRDKEKIDLLEQKGWQVLTIWECEINENLEAQLQKIKARLNATC